MTLVSLNELQHLVIQAPAAVPDALGRGDKFSLVHACKSVYWAVPPHYHGIRLHNRMVLLSQPSCHERLLTGKPPVLRKGLCELICMFPMTALPLGVNLLGCYACVLKEYHGGKHD